ncbi:MAG TPA: CRISPR-associated helicase Cas3' [Clostridiales bacterium]|nr:CRISPR-associated helicase Cas3' [Clostridiales bacterium]
MINEKYIAKTRPTKKDIQRHTDDLLYNLKRLKDLYPDLRIDWDMLRLACIYHDLGKMNSKFQRRMRGERKDTGIPHGLLSLGFIDVDYLESKGYSEKDIEVLFQAVAYHHERDVYLEMDEIVREIETMEEAFRKFEYSELPSDYFSPEFDQTFFRIGRRLYEKRDGEYFFKCVQLKGLLNRLDYAASAEIPVEEPNDYLKESMFSLMDKWKKKDPKAKWNELQEYMMSNKDENVVIIAQTGMGKTEAGFLWLDNNKGFFTLPLKSAINGIYNRVKNDIVINNIEKRIGLLHSDTLKVYSEQAEEKNKTITENDETDLEFLTYYTKTKQLSMPLTICTLDQIFDFVYCYKGFESKLATLSYSKVIIDEIQMYSPDLVAYLILGLRYITKMGGKFAIMTATLPEVILDLMQKEGIPFKEPACFTNDLVRHSIKKIERSIDDDRSIEEISKSYCNNKILVICNTIQKSKDVYNKLKASLKADKKEQIKLLHSGFIRCDRDQKEEEIIALGKKGSTGCGIWVTTQLVEASLDIDFDILYTELSDLNSLYQRMGRCYRHRKLDKDYNCFIFTGGVKRCSGVGTFIDERIHDFSKEALIDGPIDEKTKIEMIKNTYSTSRLTETTYYKEIIKTLNYIKSIPAYELRKKDVTKMFRNIDQILVIPLSVYEKNKNDICEWIDDLNEHSKSRKELIRVHECLRDLMVPVHRQLAEKSIYKCEKIGRSGELIIVDAKYNCEQGIDFKKTKNKDYRDVESRMF